MADLCTVCRGSGAIVTFKPMTFWDCLYCGGAGVRVQYEPALLTRKPRACHQHMRNNTLTAAVR